MQKINFIEYVDTVDPKVYLIAKEGSKTLSIFLERLPTTLRNNIDKEIKEYRSKYAKAREVNASYTQKEDSDNEFIVSLILKDSGEPLINLNVAVFSQSSAKKICKSWKNDAPAYYTKILKFLTSSIDEN